MSDETSRLLDSEELAPFWAGVLAGRLMLQRCTDCGTQHQPPARNCHNCWSEKLEWVNASGRARLYSYIVYRRAFSPDFAEQVPYNVCLVELAEGLRIITTVPRAAGETLKIGEDLAAAFERLPGGAVLPVFVPVREVEHHASAEHRGSTYTDVNELPEIIDAHVHLTRSRKEEDLVFHRAGWPLGWYWGNEEAILDYMGPRNISHVVTLNIMDTRSMIESRRRRAVAVGQAVVESELEDEMRERVRRFNTWACELGRKSAGIISFVMADPVLFGPQLLAEVHRCLDLGAAGLKVHPYLCGHFPDHPDMLEVYAQCADAQIPILTDTTGELDAAGRQLGAPRYWGPVIANFPSLRLIVAHLPGELWDERLELGKLPAENLFFDISGGFVDERHPRVTHRELPIEQAERVLKKIGIERVMFGSDGPGRGVDILDMASQVLRLDLTDAEAEAVLSGNAKQFFGLKT
jgi:uncharacterized protein